MTRLLRLAAVIVVAALAALAAAGCGSDERPPAIETGTPEASAVRAEPPLPPNPLAGKVFYVDPANPASQQAAKWDAARARAIDKYGRWREESPVQKVEPSVSGGGERA